MAIKKNFGMSISQQGIPVDQAADYQKVLDSRWRFVEVEFTERPVDYLVPAAAAVLIADRYTEKIPIFHHGMGFVPHFEHNLIRLPALLVGEQVQIKADDQDIFIERLVSTSGATQARYRGSVRILNINALEDYAATKETVYPGATPVAKIGVKVLDGSRPGVEVGDNSPTGFSIDTTKKILSVHKHGMTYINPWAINIAHITAINTTTDVLTLGPRDGQPFTWALTPGSAIGYDAADFVTFATPLNSTNTYYTIPVSATEIKLATSYANAIAGIAIDITAAGALPAFLTARDDPLHPTNRIFHDIGYPPSYLLAQVTIVLGKFAIDPLNKRVIAMVKSDKDYLTLGGVQSVLSGRYAYVILKDPVEIAQ